MRVRVKRYVIGYRRQATYVGSIIIGKSNPETKDIGKYSFVNRFIADWNKLREGAMGTSNGKTRIFKTSVCSVKALM